MKAIINTKYGLNHSEFKDVPKPIQGDNELLIKIRASSVTTQNTALITGKPFFVRLMTGALLKPKYKTPGNDVAGEIEAAGKNTRWFKPGDEVYGLLPDKSPGAFAEYVRAPEDFLAIKPKNLSTEEAAAVPESALVALQGLRDYGGIKKGQNVLIYSASGGIGTFAVQIAKYYGAEVTGVCGPNNVDMVRSLGADHVIDYTKEDFTKNGQAYDLVMAVRKSPPVWAIKRALKRGGTYVSTASPSMIRLFQEFAIGPRLFKREGKTIRVIVTKLNRADMIFIKELIEKGKVKPVIDRYYPLSKAAEAIRYYSQGHARGKVVVTVK